MVGIARLWWLLLFNIMVLCDLSAFSVSIPLLENWRYTFGDNPNYAKEDYLDYDWSVVQFPTTTFVFKGEKEPYTWFRKRFVVSESFSNQRLGLYTGRIHDSVEIYLNGVLIGISGSQPPNRYFGTPHTPRGFMLPSQLIRYGKDNLLAIRVYTHKKMGAFGEIVLAPYQEVKNRVRWETFLGLGIPQIITIVSLFMFIYFLFLFVKTKDVTSLFLAIGVILIGLYYTDIYLEYLPIDYLLKQKIAFSGLYLSFIFFVLFFHRFYNVQRRWLEKICWVLGVGSVALNFFMPDFPTWELIMGSFVQLIWVLPVTLYILGVNFVAMFQKKRYAWVMAIGTFFAIVFSVRDIFGVVLHMWARYWTSSWGMLVFSFSMFVSMALRTADIQQESQKKEEALAKQARRLEGLIGNMKAMSLELSKTSQQLDEEILSAKIAVEYVIDLSRNMREEFVKEIQVFQESAKNSFSVIKDIESVMQRLTRENELIQTGMGHFYKIVDMVHGVEHDIGSLKEVMEDLKKSILSSREQTSAFHDSLQGLVKKADKVFDLLGSIQRIADDTNTLAINAAIQSAHAGEYGKSFAIVGQEVRNLALTVAQLADSVNREVQQMNEELKETQRHFELVDKGLHTIVEEMSVGEALLGKFQNVLDTQKIESQQVKNTVQELNSVVGEILRSLTEQKNRTEEFARILQQTTKLFHLFVERLETQREKEEKILGVIENLSRLSQNHKAMLKEFTQIASQ